MNLQLNRSVPAAAGLACLLVGCEAQPPALPLVGTLERDRLELVADRSEPIIEIAVAEGQQVVTGDAVVRLDARLREAELSAAVARRDAADQRLAELIRGPRQQRIREARARLAGAQENLEIQTSERDRVAALVERSLASASALDQIRNAREAAQAEVEALTAALDELLEGTTAEALAQAEANLHEAEAGVELARLNVERLTVRAPSPATVDALPYEPGERPPAGGIVAVLLDSSTIYARVYVPEPLRPQVRPGLAATISVDGVDSSFAGEVRYVSSDPVFTPYYSLTQRDRSRLAYLTEIVVGGNGAAALPVGQPVEVDFPSLH